MHFQSEANYYNSCGDFFKGTAKRRSSVAPRVDKNCSQESWLDEPDQEPFEAEDQEGLQDAPGHQGKEAPAEKERGFQVEGPGGLSRQRGLCLRRDSRGGGGDRPGLRGQVRDSSVKNENRIFYYNICLISFQPPCCVWRPRGVVLQGEGARGGGGGLQTLRASQGEQGDVEQGSNSLWVALLFLLFCFYYYSLLLWLLLLLLLMMMMMIMLL